MYLDTLGRWVNRMMRTRLILSVRPIPDRCVVEESFTRSLDDASLHCVELLSNMARFAISWPSLPSRYDTIPGTLCERSPSLRYEHTAVKARKIKLLSERICGRKN